MNVKFLASFIAVATLFGCSDAPVAAVTGTPSRTDDIRVTRGEFRDVLYLTGEVESAGGETIVVPRIPNWQTTVQKLVEDGTKVEAGDVVAELDSTQFSTGLEQKRQSHADSVQSIAQQIARNEADLKQKEFDLEEKKVALEKARAEAHIPQEILPLRQWEDNQLALKRAEAEYEKATNDLVSQRKAGDSEVANLVLTKVGAERDIRIADAAIESLTLRAESGGVVVVGANPMTGRKLQTGDTVWVGMKVASIPDLSALRVTADLIDVDDGNVEIGMPVEVVVDAFPERRFDGKVIRISSVAEPLTKDSLRRGFELTIELQEADRELLRPGYSVRAGVGRRLVPDVLLVDRAAVDVAGEKPVVRRRNGSVIEGVEIGDCNPTVCIVLAGLDEGDRVAIASGVER